MRDDYDYDSEMADEQDEGAESGAKDSSNSTANGRANNANGGANSSSSSSNGSGGSLAPSVLQRMPQINQAVKVPPATKAVLQHVFSHAAAAVSQQQHISQVIDDYG